MTHTTSLERSNLAQIERKRSLNALMLVLLTSTAVPGMAQAQSIGGSHIGTTAVGGTPPVGSGINPVGIGVQPGTIAPAVPQSGSGVAVPGAGASEDRIPRVGGWKVEVKPYAQQTLTYSDNINLAPKGGEKSDFVSSTTLGVSASAETRRLRGEAGYSGTYDYYLDGNGDNGFRHEAYLQGSAELARDLFYIDAQGRITDQLSNGSGRYSGNPTAGRGDDSRVYYGAISPSLRQNLGGWAGAEVRYTHVRTHFEDAAANNEYAHIYSASLTSDPRRFQSFSWALRGEMEDFHSEDNTKERKRYNTHFGVEVPVSAITALTGTIGYDRVKPTPNFDDNINGVYGNVGVRYQPNQRLSSSAYGGWRYGGVDYGANVNYRLQDNMALSFSAGRALSTINAGRLGPENYEFRSGRVGDGRGGFLTAYRRDNWITNPNPVITAANVNQYFTTNFAEAFLRNRITGETGTYGDPRFGLVNGIAIVDNVNLALNGESGLNRYTIQAYGQQRNYETGRGKERLAGASVAVERDLSPRLTVGADAAFNHFNAGNTGESDSNTLILGLNSNYKITENFNAFARYTYSQRFADAAADEYTENAGMIGVRAQF